MPACSPSAPSTIPSSERGLDALNYACYQDARFIIVGTPSGVTLAPEGGAHQSIATPLIGMAQDGLASFEPAFVDELGLLLRFAFDYMQRSGEVEPEQPTWLRDATGGSVYFRLSTRSIEQPRRTLTPELAEAMVNGGYWLRKPGPNAEVVVAYTGAVAPEAIEAVGLMGEDRRDIGLLAVTSADRLNAGWTAAQRARERGRPEATSHVERLLADLPPHCGLVTVIGRPSGDARLDGRRAWPPHPRARRRAFRPDGPHRRALPAFRHRRAGHRGGRAGVGAGPANAPPEVRARPVRADGAPTGACRGRRAKPAAAA